MLSEATDILTLVVDQLKKHSDSEGVVTAGCGLLDALTEAGREGGRGGGERGGDKMSKMITY
jgi:hypothetical protein